MEDCNVHDITLPALQQNYTIDQAVPLLTAMLPRQPAGTQYAAGVGTFPYVFDLVRTGGKVTTELQRLTTSEIGYAYPKYDYDTAGEVLVIDSRNTRGQVVGYRQVPGTATGTITDYQDVAVTDSSGSALLDNTMTDAIFTNQQTDMDVTRGDYLYNRVDVITYPRNVVAGTTLWTLDKEFSIPASGTFLLRFTYKDPTGGTAKCGGVNVVQPVGTTDYTCFSGANGAGSSMTSALSFDYCLTGSYDTNILLRNNAAVKMYIHTFKERGDAILTYNQSESVQSDATSITTYGTRNLNYDMKYEGDPTLPAPYAGVMLNRHKNPLTQIKTVKYCANTSDQLAEYFMAIEPGDKIKLVETVSGQDNDYFVNGVSWDISGGKKLDCTYYVKRSDMEITGYQYFSQPGAEGNDTYLNSAAPTTNFGNITNLFTAGTCSVQGTSLYNTLIKFDLSSIPTNANILSAYLYLYHYVGIPRGTVNIYRIKRNWVETEATWNVYSTGNSWGSSGGTAATDISSSYVYSGTISGDIGWKTFSLDSSLVTEMLSSYYGFLINISNYAPASSSNQLVPYSSDYTDSTKRPYLVINYLL
jgi:hypothetical protein